MKKLLLLFILIPIITFSQVQIGQDINGEAAFNFSGWSTSLSSDGSVVAIGAPDNIGNGNQSGHVRVYKNVGGVWTQIGSDIDGEAAFDKSGRSISLSSDGSIIAIGAVFNDGNGDSSGHVRVYENIGGVWTQIGSDIDGEAFGDASGWSISLSSDGSVVAIGAANNDGNGNLSGHARVYENTGGVWTQIGADIDGEALEDFSGWSISLSSNGSIVAIGATDNDGNGNYSGHVRVYENIGGVWTQIGSDIDGETADDRSGRSISLSSDGSVVAIGAINNDDNGDLSGHVRVYENAGGVWTQIGSDIDGETADDRSGGSVSLSSNGSIVAIGAIYNDGNGDDSGHVRVYENVGDVWIQIGSDIDGEASGDFLGSSVSLSSNGSIIAIGANGNDNNGNNSGHVRVYDLSALLSTKEQIILDFNIYPNPVKDQFTIQLENSTELKNVNIYNNIGQLILNSKEAIINTSELSAGIYVVEIETTNGKGSKKLIIE